MLAAVKNVDQAYALLNYLYRPEVAAKVADGSGYNPVVKGPMRCSRPPRRRIHAEAYPENAVDNLWWRRRNRPGMPSCAAIYSPTNSRPPEMRSAWSERTVLKGAAASLIATPYPVRRAFFIFRRAQHSGLGRRWPSPVLTNFTARTGIKVNVIPVTRNDEQVGKLQAAVQSPDNPSIDLCQPSGDRGPLFHDAGPLAAFRYGARVKMDAIHPAILAASTSLWTATDGLYHLPHVWGAEAMAWRTDKWQRDYAVSLATAICGPKNCAARSWRGRSRCCSASVSGSIEPAFSPRTGCWMRSGDETSMKQIWTEVTKFAVDHKAWIKQFWATADEVKAGFASGRLLGRPDLGRPGHDHEEGRSADGLHGAAGRRHCVVRRLSLARGARNIDQAYALLDYLYTPAVGAEIAEGSGYNTAVAGAAALLPDAARTTFNEAYPGMPLPISGGASRNPAGTARCAANSLPNTPQS